MGMNSPAAVRQNPLQFVIPLYFMQALPVFLVQSVSLTIFKSLGVDNQVIAVWTSLIALPWSFKLLWGPIVELNGTKRRWINLTQFGIAAAIIAVALALQLPNFFGIALGVLLVTAIFSATCDIATDGYYLLATTRTQQQVFVGWQSTCFRLGRLFVTGAIVWLQSVFQNSGASAATAWTLALIALAVVYGLGALLNAWLLPKPEMDVLRTVPAAENQQNILRTILILISFSFVFFGLAFAFGLVGHLMASIPLFQKWALKDDMDWILFFVNFGKFNPILVHSINAVAGLTIGAGLGMLAARTVRGTELGQAFSTFFGQADILRILLFVLFYRFGEAMLGPVTNLFLMDKRDGPNDPTAGLGFTTEQVAVVNGIWAVVGIILGGIVGGYFISKIGIRRSLWLLAAAMNVPNILYFFAATTPWLQTPSWMSGIMFFDQFGYGFGFAGYLICLQGIAQRTPAFTTAHYAIGTGLGALLIASAGILGGALMASVDFPVIFLIVLGFTIPCILTIRLIPLRDTEGITVANTDVAD